MKGIRSVIRSMPAVHKAARYFKQRVLARLLGFPGPDDNFSTLSPPVLIALTQALQIQQQRAASGCNLLAGHGYYEFGLYQGFSFWFAEQLTRVNGAAGLHLYGFDSFEGLPPSMLEVESDMHPPGAFACSIEQVNANLKKWKADPSRFSLFPGFYSDSLFSQLRAQVDFPPVSICLIDVDLYSSCVPVLEFIRNYLVEGSILLFDDYNHFGPDDQVGERLALIEFEARHPTFRKEHLFDYGWEGVAFRVLSV